MASQRLPQKTGGEKPAGEIGIEVVSNAEWRAVGLKNLTDTVTDAPSRPAAKELDNASHVPCAVSGTTKMCKAAMISECCRMVVTCVYECGCQSGFYYCDEVFNSVRVSVIGTMMMIKYH